MISKLAIGTAQFGLDYGISNRDGIVKPETVRRILKCALDSNVGLIDTASAYGSSEVVLGSVLSDFDDSAFQIISKCSLTVDKSVQEQLDETLMHLNRDKIYGYLGHSVIGMDQNAELLSNLFELKTKGKIEKIGITVYYPEDVEVLLSSSFSLDIVQLPYSIFDRRFEYLFPELRKRNIEIHVRSVFLQGLFFLESAHLNPHFNPVRKKMKSLHLLAQHVGVSIAQILLAFVLRNPMLDHVVVGVTSVAEFEELKQANEIPLSADVLSELLNYKVDDNKILIPMNWPKDA